MQYLWFILTVVAGALLNRARGNNFGGIIASDTEDRLVSMSGLAAITTLYFHPIGFSGDTFQFGEIVAYGLMFTASLFLLWLWCAESWDPLWGEATGLIVGSNRFIGTIKLTVRMALILPFYIFLLGIKNGPVWHGIYATSFLLMGVTYFLSSVLRPGPYIIRNAEWANGAIIGATIWLIGA